jgi:hypothetical protein
MRDGASGPGSVFPTDPDDEDTTWPYPGPAPATRPAPPTVPPAPPTAPAVPPAAGSVPTVGRAWPTTPSVPVTPAVPTAPTVPSVPAAHSFPSVPTAHSAPAAYSVPSVPTEPGAPATSSALSIPTASSASPGSSAPPPDVMRYGPGVPTVPPASQAGLTAEHVWRTGRPAQPPPRRRGRLRRLSGSALTVILLAVSGVLLYTRFHHAPFHVTGVQVSRPTQTGCGVDVTGHIITNGSAGTVSYEWVFRPDPRPPQPLSQSVVAGQHDVYVTVAVQGQGRGTAAQQVTLQVLGPDPRSGTTSVVVSC